MDFKAAYETLLPFLNNPLGTHIVLCTRKCLISKHFIHLCSCLQPILIATQLCITAS